MKFLVSYQVDNILPDADGIAVNRPQGQNLTVDAENKVQAFIKAYKLLVSQGHMVRTVSRMARYRNLGADDSEGYNYSMARLSSDEMKEVYEAGVPEVWQDEYERTAMTHIENVQAFEFDIEMPVPEEIDFNVKENVYVDEERLGQLANIESSKFDLVRLIQLCKEANICYTNKCYLAVAMITRSVIDHVPPIFGFEKFAQIANNYAGSSSFKESMQHLEQSSRKIADAHLHTHIRKKEILPTRTQENFSNDIDLLLAEIIRILSDSE